MTLINQLLRETLDASVLEGIRKLRVGGEERKEKIISEILSKTEKERTEVERYIGDGLWENRREGVLEIFRKVPNRKYRPRDDVRR